jgi:hypothetical protein
LRDDLAGSKVMDVISDIFGDDTVVLGQGDAQVMVAGDAEAKVKDKVKGVHGGAVPERPFLVVISHPQQDRHAGLHRPDIAEDQSACES